MKRTYLVGLSLISLLGSNQIFSTDTELNGTAVEIFIEPTTENQVQLPETVLDNQESLSQIELNQQPEITKLNSPFYSSNNNLQQLIETQKKVNKPLVQLILANPQQDLRLLIKNAWDAGLFVNDDFKYVFDYYVRYPKTPLAKEVFNILFTEQLTGDNKAEIMKFLTEVCMPVSSDAYILSAQRGYEKNRMTTRLGYLIEWGYLHVFEAIISALTVDDVIQFLIDKNSFTFEAVSNSTGRILVSHNYERGQRSLLEWWDRDQSAHIKPIKPNKNYIQALNLIAIKLCTDDDFSMEAPYELGRAFSFVYAQRLLNNDDKLLDYDQLTKLITTKVALLKKDSQE